MKRLTLRIEDALYDDLSDEALRRKITITAEITRRLQLKRWSKQTDRELGYVKPVRPVEDIDAEVDWMTPSHSWHTRG